MQMTAFSKDDLHIFEIQLWKSSERNLLICFRQREETERYREASDMKWVIYRMK